MAPRKRRKVVEEILYLKAGEPEYYFVFCNRVYAVCFTCSEASSTRIAEFQKGPAEIKNK
jgi:hypothetical protein